MTSDRIDEQVLVTLDNVVRALSAESGQKPEYREGQRQMVTDVASALINGTTIAIQAGTGVGKSLGYLVPAVLSGRRVVVATATKALQDQLAQRDLPLLQRTAGVPFRFAVLKGRNNYACQQRMSEFTRRSDKQAQLEGVTDNKALDAEIEKLIPLITKTPSGDRAHLSVEPSPRAWSALSVSSSECPGATNCEYGETCFSENAKRTAAESDVIVVNQHLYASHIASGGYVLPDHDAVVFDEAHELEDILANSLGVTVSTSDLAQVASRARRVLFIDQVEVQRCDDLDRDALKLSTMLASRLGEALSVGAEATMQSLLIQINQRLGKIVNALKATEVDGDRQALKLRTIGLASASQEAIVSTLSPTGAIVTWVSGTAHAPTLVTSPLDVSNILTKKLWPELNAAVLTSATLASATVQRLGIPSSAYKTVESPFDYKQNALLYVAKHLPDPRQAKWLDAAVQEACALVKAAGGRTLVLCTSHANVAQFAKGLRASLKTPVLAQDDLPRVSLVQKFADEPETTLVATTGFWQGVDVPGDTCVCVIIDKIPFARPDDPLTAARREFVGDQAFRLVDLPRAATMLAQGAGRLIRTTTDQGVVAVLDSRLATAGYRKSLLEIMPPMKRTIDQAEVLQKLQEITTTG